MWFYDLDHERQATVMEYLAARRRPDRYMWSVAPVCVSDVFQAVGSMSGKGKDQPGGSAMSAGDSEVRDMLASVFDAEGLPE